MSIKATNAIILQNLSLFINSVKLSFAEQNDENPVNQSLDANCPELKRFNILVALPSGDKQVTNEFSYDFLLTALFR